MSLISPDYLDLQKQLHAAPKGYGRSSGKWAETVAGLALSIGARDVLDYGCGQGALKEGLLQYAPRLAVREYDPAIPSKSGEPAMADLVVCTDVLEHIEPDCIDAVLDHLKALTRKRLFTVISLVPAQKILADGRNAHILLKPREWWNAALLSRFNWVHSVACRDHKEMADVWGRR